MIKELLKRIFIQNWQRKIVAFISAVAIWFLVHRSLDMDEAEFLEPSKEKVFQEKIIEDELPKAPYSKKDPNS